MSFRSDLEELDCRRREEHSVHERIGAGNSDDLNRDVAGDVPDEILPAHEVRHRSAVQHIVRLVSDGDGLRTSAAVPIEKIQCHLVGIAVREIQIDLRPWGHGFCTSDGRATLDPGARHVEASRLRRNRVK